MVNATSSKAPCFVKRLDGAKTHYKRAANPQLCYYDKDGQGETLSKKEENKHCSLLSDVTTDLFLFAYAHNIAHLKVKLEF